VKTLAEMFLASSHPTKVVRTWRAKTAND